MTKAKEVIGYMCGVDWQCEIGQAAGGNRIFATPQDLKRNYPCVEECGIVKVKVSFVEWTEEQTLGRKKTKK